MIRFSMIHAGRARRARARRRLMAGVACLMVLGACGAPQHSAAGVDHPSSGRAPVVVASTPIIADMVANVAPEATIHTLVPMGADPHTFEPSMAALRDITRADVAFSNKLLLEQQALLATIDANLPENAPHIGLGEEAVKFGGYQIPLVENVSLSTIWLGLRVDGAGGSTDTVTIEATSADGPGEISAFTTGTFGEPTPWISSHDGIDQSDSIELPTNAHTHMSWGFTRQGRYELGLKAVLHTDDADRILGEATLTFEVGTDPHASGRTVIDSGHMDITAHLDGGLDLYGDGPNGQNATFNPAQTVIAVPNTTATTVPDQRWRFLGDPGEEAWILAQAVIGKHVHGEVDPHLWHDVDNAVAYVEVIAEEMAAIDPAGAASYAKNAANYIDELKVLDNWAATVFGSIPEAKRTLITAHDSFGYLAKGYNLQIAGFVAPNPSLEPSVQQIANLTRTLQSTPAAGVFLEPTSNAHVSELISVARATDKNLCNIYSDTLTSDVPTYVALVEHNVRSIKSCLDPQSLPAWPLNTHTSIPNPQGE